MCQHNFEICFNSRTNNLYKKAIRNIFHLFTGKLTHFHLATKNKMNLFAAVRLQTIVTYVTHVPPAFLYTLVKMLILKIFKY